MFRNLSRRKQLYPIKHPQPITAHCAHCSGLIPPTHWLKADKPDPRARLHRPSPGNWSSLLICISAGTNLVGNTTLRAFIEWWCLFGVSSLCDIMDLIVSSHSVVGRTVCVHYAVPNSILRYSFIHCLFLASMVNGSVLFTLQKTLVRVLV